MAGRLFIRPGGQNVYMSRMVENDDFRGIEAFERVSYAMVE
jgi:hypothetical protein